MYRQITLNEFEASDELSKIRMAIQYLKNHPYTSLKIPQGDYILADPMAKQLQEDLMAGKYSNWPESKMFHKDFTYVSGLDFSDIHDVEIIAYGVNFITDGFMETISLQFCKNITLKGLSLDMKRRPFSKGKIISATDQYTDVYFDDTFLLSKNNPYPRYGIYNHKTDRFLFGICETTAREQLDEHTIRIHNQSYPEQIGHDFYVTHTMHFRPAILIYEAKDITLEDVTIHAHDGMGIVGHRSENIQIKGLSVKPAGNNKISVNTDATHFTSCKGYLKYENCFFSGHGDDALNVHTYYQTILSHHDNICSLQVQAPTGTHAQKMDYPDPGDILELVDKYSLAPRKRFTVLSSDPDHKNWICKVELNDALPDDCSNYLFVNVTQMPEVTFSNCICQSHRSRSILIKAHHAKIENCIFKNNSGTAIHIAAEGYWHEGACSKNVIIKNNIIENCGYGDGMILDAGGISVNILAPDANMPVHEKITIEQNIILSPDTKYAISVGNTKQVIIKNNVLHAADDGIETHCCLDEYIQNNIII